MTNSIKKTNGSDHLLRIDNTNDTKPVTSIAQQALAQKPNLSTGLWEHIKTVGDHHQFRLKISLRDYAYGIKAVSYNNTVFPAIECYPERDDINELIKDKNQIDAIVPADLAPTQRQEFLDLLISLGYSCELINHNIYLTLPGLEALQNGLEQSPFSYLKNLTIEASKGISSDQHFIESFLEKDCLLSNDKEFVHDHAAHVLLQLSIAFETKENYPQFKEQVRYAIKSLIYEPLLWNKIKGSPLHYVAMWAFLGKIVDVLQTMSHQELNKTISQEGVNQFYEIAIDPIKTLSKQWEIYFEKRFPKISLNHLKMEWYLMLTYYFASKVDVPQARIDKLTQETPYSLEKISWLPQIFFFLHNKKPVKKLDKFMIRLKSWMDQPRRPDFL